MTRALVAALAIFLAPACDEKKDAQPAAPVSGSAAATASGHAAAPAGPTGEAAAPAGPTGEAAAPKAAPSGDKADVKGTVAVTGKVPAMEDLKRNSDAFCAKKQMKDETVIAGKKGELANVVVHINGL